MPTGYRIALFGMGKMGRILLSGAAALTVAETNNKESTFNFDILKVTEPADYTTLVKAYKNVQKKYYPEKDTFRFIKKDIKIF